MLAGVKNLDVNHLPEVLLIFGEEEFLCSEALEYIEKNIVSKISDQYDCDTLSKENATLEKILDIARSYPFLSQKRTVIVKDFDTFFSPNRSGNKKDVEQTPLYKYLQSPQPSTFLVLTAKLESMKGVSKKKNFGAAKFPFDIILSKHEWIEFPKVWENTFAGWVKNRLKEHGKTISSKGLEILISQTTPTLRDLSNEIDKLLLYVLDKPNISDDDAIATIGTSRQFNVFELSKAVGQKDLSKSLDILQNILAVERAEMLILAILTKYFTATWRLSELGQVNESNKLDIAKKIGVTPYYLNDYVVSLQRYGIARIDRSFTYLCEADEALKTGATGGKAVLQNLLIKLMN